MTGEPPPPQGPGRPGERWDWDSWSRQWVRRGSVRTGVILVVLGLLFLLANLGLLGWLRWDVVWPVLLILLGIWLVTRRR